MIFTNEQIKYIKGLGKFLVDDGDNQEYTRGVCELIATMDCIKDVSHDDRTEQIQLELLHK